MEHCPDHIELVERLTVVTTQIEEMRNMMEAMHGDIKDTRKVVLDAVAKAEAQLVTNTKDVAIHGEKFKGVDWRFKLIVTGMIIIGTTLVLEWFKFHSGG